jgi:multidrug efflux system outer membrane protein
MITIRARDAADVQHRRGARGILPIFAGGANVASFNLATVQKNINIVQYEQAIQTAFREVADALAGRGTLDTQIAADQALVEATSESYRLSDMGFRGWRKRVGNRC